MKLSDKNLLIQDLCERLPYGVVIECGKKKYKEYLAAINNCDIVNYIYKLEDVKPCLLPLDSMTEEQRKEYYNICRTDWIDNKSKDIDRIEVLYKGVDWLNKNHFDYRGLIDKGLAIDATNLNIY